MKIAITGDTQFQGKSIQRDSELWSSFIDELIEKNIMELIHLGDVFERFNIADRNASFGSIFNAFCKPIQKYIRARGEVIVLKGNHDDAGSSYDDALAGLDGRKGVTVVRNPQKINLVSWKKITLFCMPWLRREEREDNLDFALTLKDWENLNQDEINILLGHFTVRGSNLGSYMMVHDEFEFGLPDIQKFDYAFVGHIHKKQELARNVIIPGVLWQHDFGEENYDTGYYLLEESSKGQNLQYCKTDSPRYWTVSVEDYQERPWNPGDQIKIRGILEPDFDYPENVIFEKAPDKDDFQMRTDLEGIENNPHALFDKWTEVNNLEMKDSQRKDCHERINEVERLTSSMGSLKKINRIKAQNIARWRELDVKIPEGIVGISGANGCLSGDTMIDCPRNLRKYPKGILMKNLVGKNPWVYAWKDGIIVIRQASKVQLTGKNVPVIKIKVSKHNKTNKRYSTKNGGIIGRNTPPLELIGTYDHLVLLSNGKTWKKLGELKKGDRLCSLYRRMHTRIKKDGKGEESVIYWTNHIRGNRGTREHRFIASEIFKESDKNLVIHHKDHNELNHSIENIEYMKNGKHSSYHGMKRYLAGDVRWGEKIPRRFLGCHHTNKAKEKISIGIKKHYDQKGRRHDFTPKKCLCGCGGMTNGYRYIFNHHRRGVPGRKRGACVNGEVINHEVMSSEFMGYQDVYDITVPGADSFVANGIVVHNSSKSFLLEIPFCTLFGDFPSKGQVYGGLSSDIGRMEIGFEAGEKEYIAERMVKEGKNRSQETSLYQNGNRIAGVKVSDFDREIENLVGKRELILASIMSSQNLSGDLIEADPSERKELFGQFLGLDAFQEFYQKMKDEKNLLGGAISEKEKQIQSLQERMKEFEGSEMDLEKEKKNLQELKNQESVMKGSYEYKQKEFMELGSKKTEITTRIEGFRDEKKLAEERLRKIDVDTIDSKRKLDEGKETQIHAKEIEKRYEELKDVRRKYENLLLENQKQVELEIERKNIEYQIVEKKRRIENEKNGLELQREKLQNNVKLLKSNFDNLQGKLKAYEGAGCKPNYLKCTFLEDVDGVEDKITKVMVEIQSLEIMIEEIEMMLLDESYCQEERGRIKNLEDEKSKIVVKDISRDIQESKKIVSSMQEFESKYMALQGIKERLKAISENLEKNLEMMGECEKNIMEIGKKSESLEREMNQIVLLVSDVEKNVEELGKELNELYVKIDGQNSKVGSLQAQQEMYEKMMNELGIKKEELKTESDTLEVIVLLYRAFGKDGIPQLLIDNAIPQLSLILRDMLKEFDNAFSIEIVTQEAIKSGALKEVFKINVSDDQGVRDIRWYSGGEQRILKQVFRLALAVFQTQRLGGRYQVFFADEMFDQLVDENKQKMLRLVMRLSDYFKQVFVVSHDDYLLQDLPFRLDVERRGKWSNLKVIDRSQRETVKV